MKEDLNLNEYSMWTQKKYDYEWYEWCVFVDESEEVLSTIKSVQYALHPSFPDPLRIAKDRFNCFGLFSAGWGGFSINLVVKFVDGSTLKKSHFLQLLNNWPKKPAPDRFDSEEEKSIYQALIHEKYRWRKFETVISTTNLSKGIITDILYKLEKENYVRKAYFKSVDNKDLWGATSVVGIAPRPK